LVETAHPHRPKKKLTVSSLFPLLLSRACLAVAFLSPTVSVSILNASTMPSFSGTPRHTSHSTASGDDLSYRSAQSTTRNERNHVSHSAGLLSTSGASTSRSWSSGGHSSRRYSNAASAHQKSSHHHVPDHRYRSRSISPQRQSQTHSSRRRSPSRARSPLAEFISDDIGNLSPTSVSPTNFGRRQCNSAGGTNSHVNISSGSSNIRSHTSLDRDDDLYRNTEPEGFKEECREMFGKITQQAYVLTKFYPTTTLLTRTQNCYLAETYRAPLKSGRHEGRGIGSTQPYHFSPHRPNPLSPTKSTSTTQTKRLRAYRTLLVLK
jgi:hypothetical protein